FGDGFALLCSAALFTLPHVLPVRFPFAFVMGLVIGYFVLFTGSVWTGVAIHFANNAITLAAMQLEQTGGFAVGLMAAHLLLLTVGIVAAVLLMRWYDGMFALRPSASINTEGQKVHSFFGNLPMLLLLALVAVLAAGYLA
ncbi:MAG: CPBP family intramembrane glutamic endopeptidase, partial [Oscillospiraceae bacterium]